MSSVLKDQLSTDLLLTIFRYVDSKKVTEVSKAMNLNIDEAYWKMMIAEYNSEKTPKQVYHMLTQNKNKKMWLITDKPHLTEETKFSIFDLSVAASYGSIKAIRHIIATHPQHLRHDLSLRSAIKNWDKTSSLETIELLVELGTCVSYDNLVKALLDKVPLPCLITLINKYAEKNDLEKDADGNRLITEAVRCDRLDVVDYLLTKGGKLESPGDLSCMHYVHSEEAVKYFLDKGLDVNQDSNGVTPLLIAVEAGSAEGVDALIKHGANLNHQDEEGDTPLMAALDAFDCVMIEHLLQYKDKMDLTLVNRMGQSILFWQPHYPTLFATHGLVPEGYVQPKPDADDDDDDDDEDGRDDGRDDGEEFSWLSRPRRSDDDVSDDEPATSDGEE